MEIPQFNTINEAIAVYGEELVLTYVNNMIRKKFQEALLNLKKSGASEEEIAIRMKSWTPIGFKKNRMTRKRRELFSSLTQEQIEAIRRTHFSQASTGAGPGTVKKEESI